MAPLTGIATVLPEPTKCCSQAKARLAWVFCLAPGQGGPQVILFSLQPLRPGDPFLTLVSKLCFLCHLQEEAGMAPCEAHSLLRRELLGRILAHGFQQTVSHRFARLIGHDERALLQLLQILQGERPRPFKHVTRGRVRGRAPSADRFRRQ